MDKILFTYVFGLLLMIGLISCGGKIKDTKSEVKNIDKQTETIKEEPSVNFTTESENPRRIISEPQGQGNKQAPQNLKQDWGIELKEIPEGTRFCDWLNLSSEKILKTSLMKASCTDTDVTDITVMNGKLVFSKFKKDYAMLVQYFKSDESFALELPKERSKEILGQKFGAYDISDRPIRVFMSNDMIRLYPNSTSKILISNYLIDDGQGEMPSDNRAEMIELAKVIISKIEK